MNRVFCVLLTMLFVLLANQSNAQDKSKPAMWKWASSSDSKESSMFNGPQIKWPKMPTFQGVKNSTGRAFNSAKQTTGRMWNSTVDFLNPWDDESKSKSKSSSTSSNEGGAWFFQKKEEKPAYSTVNDFLKQERPRL